MPKILVVEDDANLGNEVVGTLERAGHVVRWCTDGATARREDIESYDLVILDLMLPNVHGFDLLKRWRESSEVPVIILTAKTDTHDKVRGFSLGGDDYVTKPFWPEELIARVDARLRRPAIISSSRDIGPLTLFEDEREVKVNGELIDLTRVEFDILALLISRLDKSVSRAQIVERVLDEESEGGFRTLDVHVSRIRKKLGDAGVHLETVWGIGYRFASSPKTKA
ncbi:response regulator transcription factor [Microvenator marinus]|jgi:two-component system response regulator MtrA|uniref:Response regulator transcription factor n=1 Tax=Microvenator marinus TaxID=2600177 RepID=A0A5B8XRA1_9DELT|nr:response regulator transcription factor [Microvenator marinus]QED26603.1 response regulator transcription factor [Microvenator marinus]